MEFEKLLSLFAEPDDVLTRELYEAVRELLVRKAETEEKDLNPQIPVIIDFIRNECQRQKRLSEELPDDHRYDFTGLNEAFRGLLAAYNGVG